MSQRLAQPDQIERLSWDEFRDSFEWRQGEHLTVLGPTGSGKTTLIVELLDCLPWVVVFGTKGRDETLHRLISEQGYRRIKRWEERSPTDKRIVLWPDSRKLTAPVVQRQAFERALAHIFPAGGWAVVFDEVLEFTQDLRMPNIVKRFWRQGRSNYLSVVAGSQRPVDVPLLAYSSATHLFLWNTNDLRDSKRFSEISGFVDRRAIQRIVMELPQHDVLYVNTRTGALTVTNTQQRG